MSFCAHYEQYGADALAWPGQGKNLKSFFFLSTLFSFFSAPKPPDPRNLAASHYYNFVWSNGIKTNSLDPNQAEYIFVTANTGFHVSFLAYHDALQFRGYLSNHAIAWSQTNALWADDHAHARFHKDYALARLLVWMKKIASIY